MAAATRTRTSARSRRVERASGCAGASWTCCCSARSCCSASSAACSCGPPRSHRDDLTGGDPKAFLAKQVVNLGIGLGLMVVVAATDHRWVRILAPVGYGWPSSAWCSCW